MIIFGTFDVLKKQPDTQLIATTNKFLNIRRAIKLLYGRKSLNEIFHEHHDSITSYIAMLMEFCEIDNSLLEQLCVRENHVRNAAGRATEQSFNHTTALMDELLATGEWDTLIKLAERYCKTGWTLPL